MVTHPGVNLTELVGFVKRYSVRTGPTAEGVIPPMAFAG
jgi:hypothetical protein